MTTIDRTRDALLRAMTDHQPEQFLTVLRESLAQAFAEGYAFRDPKGAKPLAGDNPYEDDQPKTVRDARVISMALKRGGVTTGYRYTQSGYVDRHSRFVEGPGVMITRQHEARYGGREDLGEVRIYLIQNPRSGSGDPNPEFVEQVGAALRAAGLPYHVQKGGGLFTVPDDEPDVTP